MADKEVQVAESRLDLAVNRDPLRKYTLELHDLERVAIVVKNNTILGMEEFGEDGLALNGLDVQVLSTALLAAHILKERGDVFTANTVFSIPIANFCQIWRMPSDSKARRNGNIYRDSFHVSGRRVCGGLDFFQKETWPQENPFHSFVCLRSRADGSGRWEIVSRSFLYSGDSFQLHLWDLSSDKRLPLD